MPLRAVLGARGCALLAGSRSSRKKLWARLSAFTARYLHAS
jgi:hypothetical protein